MTSRAWIYPTRFGQVHMRSNGKRQGRASGVACWFDARRAPGCHVGNRRPGASWNVRLMRRIKIATGYWYSPMCRLALCRRATGWLWFSEHGRHAWPPGSRARSILLTGIQHRPLPSRPSRLLPRNQLGSQVRRVIAVGMPLFSPRGTAAASFGKGYSEQPLRPAFAEGGHVLGAWRGGFSFASRRTIWPTCIGDL